MSHNAVYASQLTNIDQELLGQAFAILAEKHNGQLGTQVLNYLGREPVDCLIALRCGRLPNCIGVKITAEGNLEFTGDSYNVEAAWEEMLREIQNTYTALAYAGLTCELGGSVVPSETDEEIILEINL